MGAVAGAWPTCMAGNPLAKDMGPPSHLLHHAIAVARARTTLCHHCLRGCCHCTNGKGSPAGARTARGPIMAQPAAAERRLALHLAWHSMQNSNLFIATQSTLLRHRHLSTRPAESLPQKQQTRLLFFLLGLSRNLEQWMQTSWLLRPFWGNAPWPRDPRRRRSCRLARSARGSKCQEDSTEGPEIRVPDWDYTLLAALHTTSSDSCS